MSSPASPTSSATSSQTPEFALATPETIHTKLHFRKGQPLTRCRSTKDLPDPQSWTHNLEDDSFVFIRERIKQRAAGIKGFVWPEDEYPYIQPTHSSAQKNFHPLNEENFQDGLVKAWRAEARRLHGDSTQVFVHLYAYLVATDEGRSTIQRATRSRLQTAHKVISNAMNQQNLPNLGTMTVNHLARRLARLPSMPSSDNVEVPPTNTFRQIQHLDSQVQALDQMDQLEAAERGNECRTIIFVIDGHEVPLRFKVESMRHTLGLPRFDLTNIANFEGDSLDEPVEDMDDVDHEEIE